MDELTVNADCEVTEVTVNGAEVTVALGDGG